MQSARTSRLVLAALLAGVMALGSLAGPQAHAQNYPQRSIEWVVGWGAGGGSDLFARSLATPLSEELGVAVAVVNMPGASAIIAHQYVMNQPADGYTLFAITPDLYTNELMGLTTLSYRDLIPIMRAHVDVGMLHTGDNSSFARWQDVVDYARARPGALQVGGIGAASFDEAVLTILLESAGLEFNYIPYESASEMHLDLLAGRIDIMYEEPSSALSLIEDGGIRPLLVATDRRLERFPDVPSAGEFGYEIPPAMWRGVAVKKGTAPEIVAVLERALARAAQAETYVKFEKDRLLDLYPGYMGSEEFLQDMHREFELYRSIVERMNP